MIQTKIALKPVLVLFITCNTCFLTNIKRRKKVGRSQWNRTNVRTSSSEIHRRTYSATISTFQPLHSTVRIHAVARVVFVAGYPRACHFPCAQIGSRKARERELAIFDENRRAVGMLNPVPDEKMKVRTGGKGGHL